MHLYLFLFFSSQVEWIWSNSFKVPFFTDTPYGGAKLCKKNEKSALLSHFLLKSADFTLL